MKKMNYVLNKATISCVSTLLSLSAFAITIPTGPCNDVSESCCEKPLPGPFGFAYSEDGTAPCPKNFYFHGDLLFMQAQETGLEWGITDSNGPGFPVDNGDVAAYSSNDNDWEWDVGARLGMGFFSKHDNWDLGINWMYYQVHNDRNAQVSPNAVLIPLWAPPNMSVNGTMTDHSARWELRMNQFDLTIGKLSYISRYFTLKPNFGIRAAWIDQTYTARIGGVVADPSTIGLDMRAINNFWGAGVRALLETRWIMGGGIELIGNAGTSFLFGKFNVDQNTSGQLSSIGYAVREGLHKNLPTFDLTLGLAWAYQFNRVRLNLQAAWEFHEYLGQNRLRRFFDSGSTISTDLVSRGDLSLSGGSLRIELKL